MDARAALVVRSIGRCLSRSNQYICASTTVCSPSELIIVTLSTECTGAIGKGWAKSSLHEDKDQLNLRLIKALPVRASTAATAARRKLTNTSSCKVSVPKPLPIRRWALKTSTGRVVSATPVSSINIIEISNHPILPSPFWNPDTPPAASLGRRGQLDNAP